jgi:uncharacterized protein (TIGR03435 family)
MFDRFTVRATRVLFHARAQASELGGSAIEPEHILLGILEEGQGLGGRILARNVNGQNLWADIVRHLAGHERVPESKELPFSASCQRALGYAFEEADLLSHDAIGTEHLLLGLLREEQSFAAAILSGRGLTGEEVRQAIREFTRDEEPDPPGPPPTPANTYRWPQIPFVPSRTVHILYSGMQWPTQPVINFPGSAFSAYGFTLEEMVVRAWDGNRWHVDIPPGLRSDVRYDFLMVLPQEETWDTCLGLLQSAIERQFAVHITRETRVRDVYRITDTGRRGRLLRRYLDPPPGTGFSSLRFPVFMGRSQDTPMFPVEPFAVHSVPFPFLVSWFEEILGGQVVDEAGLRGIYGFELKERAITPEAFIELLRGEAGLAITREQREVPTLIIRRRNPTVEGTDTASG